MSKHIKKGKVITGMLAMLVCIVLSSCKTGTETLKPMISGAPGEVLLVLPDYQWNGPIGDTLRALLDTEVPNLPQPEPLFTIIHVNPQGFDKIFYSHRNIVILKTGSQYTESRIVVSQDRWARSQLIIEIESPSDDALLSLLNTNGKDIVDRINKAERDRIISNYRAYIEPAIYKKIKDKYHITLDVPKGYSLDVDSTDFAWVASETPTTSQGILIYEYPYTSELELSPANLIRTRNFFLRKYVKGPVAGTYMSTETLLPPLYSEFTLNGDYVAELKGLWKLENGFMGGPFISFSTVDKYRGKVVTVEGFVYAPSEHKRELLRQVESILYTLKVVPPETTGK